MVMEMNFVRISDKSKYSELYKDVELSDVVV
jgi:hypothetical protein